MRVVNPEQEVFEVDLAQQEAGARESFDKLIALGQRQVWIVAGAAMFFLILTAVYAVVLGQVPIVAVDTGWIAAAIALPLVCAAAVFFYLTAQRFLIQRQGFDARRNASRFFSTLVHAIRTNAQIVANVPVQNIYRLDETILSDLQLAVDDVLRGSERYRRIKRDTVERASRFAQSTRLLVGRSVLNSLLTLVGIAFVALQSFDLLLDFLHYTRTEQGYRHQELFRSMDAALLNNLYFVAVAVLVAVTFGITFVLVIFLAARYSVAIAAREILRVADDVDRSGPTDEELMQITSGLVRQLVELFGAQARRP